MHSAVAQAQGARAGGTHVRRKEIETVHPIVRVHPVTGWKSIFVNPGKSHLSLACRTGTDYQPLHVAHLGFTRRIVGIPKAESDAILRFLFSQIGLDPGFYVRFRWEKNSVAIWDNRVSSLISFSFGFASVAAASGVCRDSTSYAFVAVWLAAWIEFSS